MLCTLILFYVPFFTVSANYSFLSLGDWGGAALPSPHPQTVNDVAQQLAKTAQESNSKFLVNTGDNFYWCGIQNTSDFQIGVDFIKPYADQVLSFDWYGVLGNHEYGYNVSAQIDLSNRIPNWIMDDRYYTRRVKVATDVYISFIFIDTSPCIKEYRSSSKKGWDPCGSEYPTCSLVSDPDDQFEGPCKFHPQIIEQDCGKQFTWFQNALSNVDTNDWLIVVGHHPADEIDVEDFTSALQKRGIDLYLNGHAHTLTHYIVDGKGYYVTTGAGAMVPTDDQFPTTPGKYRTHSKVHGFDLPKYNNHTYKQIWNGRVAGFTRHTFNSDYSKLTTDYITYKGDIVHSFTQTKGSSRPDMLQI